MAKTTPFKGWRVKTEITDRLETRKAQEHYHGSMTSYIEGILDRYADNLLIPSETTKEVKAIRVRRLGGEGEQRKTA